MSFVDIANWLTIVDGSDGAQQDISFTAPQGPPAGQPAGPAPKLRRVGSITARGGRRAARGGPLKELTYRPVITGHAIITGPLRVRS